VRAQDGLAALSERAEASLDLIVRDAFGQDAVPAHLAGEEWWEHARRVLRQGGLVVANAAVTPSSPAASSDASAARDAFAEVLAVGEHAVLRRKRRGNVVLVASAMPQPHLAAALARYAASAPLPTGVDETWR
jgi:spermidine synthase